jgi:hypothetical protein
MVSGIAAPVLRQADGEVDGALVFTQPCETTAPPSSMENSAVQFARGNAVGEGAFAVELDAQLRDLRLHVEFGVFEAGDGRGDFLDRSPMAVMVCRSGPKI